MIINFGSINVDHVYRVTAMPKPGETLAAKSCDRFLGGKGVNQSIAAHKSGAEVKHVGAVGPDGDWVLEQIKSHGVELSDIKEVAEPTGHAVILVDDEGENQIVIFSGANLELTFEQVDAVLAKGDPTKDWVLLQNETNLTAEIGIKAKVKGYKVAYAAAPFSADAAWEMIGTVDLLAVNEGEEKQLAEHLGAELNDAVVPMVLVTKGANGAELRAHGKVFTHAAFNVSASDTTGAGDTFLGAFLASYALNGSGEEALAFAAASSAIQVTRPGAADAIPSKEEVEAFLKEREL